MFVAVRASTAASLPRARGVLACRLVQRVVVSGRVGGVHAPRRFVVRVARLPSTTSTKVRTLRAL